MSKAKHATKKCSARKRRKQRRQDDNVKQIHDAIKWLLSPGFFDRLAFHGNTSWLAAELVVLALLWIWSDCAKLTEAFDDARASSVKLLGKAALTTYQGLAGALQTWTPRFMPLLQVRLHELMEQIGRRRLRVGIGRKQVHLLTSVLNESKLRCKEFKKLYENAGEWSWNSAHSNKPSSAANCAVASANVRWWRWSGRSLGWP